MKNSAREQNVAILRVNYVRYELCKPFLRPVAAVFASSFKTLFKGFFKTNFIIQDFKLVAGV